MCLKFSRLQQKLSFYVHSNFSRLLAVFWQLVAAERAMKVYALGGFIFYLNLRTYLSFKPKLELVKNVWF